MTRRLLGGSGPQEPSSLDGMHPTEGVSFIWAAHLRGLRFHVGGRRVTDSATKGASSLTKEKNCSKTRYSPWPWSLTTRRPGCTEVARGPGQNQQRSNAG